MAAYTVTQMTAGVLGEVLTGGTAYTFTIATPAYTSQSVYFGSATFITDSSLSTNYNLSQSAIAAGIDESIFSGSLAKLIKDRVSIPSVRGSRYFAQSKMGFLRQILLAF